MAFGKTIPILRIFDAAKAKEFYIDFLGFKVDWQHRFEDGLPLYMQISKRWLHHPLIGASWRLQSRRRNQD